MRTVILRLSLIATVLVLAVWSIIPPEKQLRLGKVPDTCDLNHIMHGGRLAWPGEKGEWEVDKPETRNLNPSPLYCRSFQTGIS